MLRRVPILLALALVGVALGVVALRPGAAPLPPSAPDARGAEERVQATDAEPDPARSLVPFAWSVRVVDEAGAPVTGVPISIGRKEAVRRAVSDAEGVAGFRQPFAGNTRAVVIDDPAFALVGPESLREDDADGARIIIRRRTPMAGRVVFDDTDDGVPGVELSATGVPGSRSRTDADGRFLLFADAAPGGLAEIVIVDPGPCIGLAKPSGPWWGRDDVVIRLPRARRVVVEAIAADTGEPLEEFAVRLRPVGLRTIDEGEVAGYGAAGHALVSGAWPGTNDLQVLPVDPRYAPSEVVTFVLRESEPPTIRIAVAARRTVTVAVVDSIGRPVADASVGWIDPRGRGRVREPLVKEGELPMRPKWRHRSALRQVAAGRSDRAGSVSMHVDADARGQIVVVKPPVGEKVTVRVAAVDELDGPVVVEVAAFSTVHVRLVPPVPAEWNPRVELRLRGRRAAARRADVSPGGGATLTDVPSGSYELVLTGSGVPESARFLDVTWLRNVVVAGGRDEQLTIDAVSLVPSWVRGTVRDADGPSDPRVELWDGHELLGRSAVARDGSFSIGPVWSRNGVRLRLRFGDAAAPVRRWDLAGPFDLGWGARSERELVLGRSALEARLLGADGEPVPAGSVLEVRREGDPAVERALTDADGTVRLERLGPGRQKLTARIAGSRASDLGIVELVDGRLERLVLAVH